MSVHGLEIELKLNDYIQGEIREAVLYSEPWQLLEQLQERLKEARKDKLKRNRIKRLVDGTSSPKHIEKMKNPKMNWHIVRFIIRQRTYVMPEQGSLTIYHVLFRLIIKKENRYLC